MLVQAEDIRGRFDQSIFPKRDDVFFPKPFYIKSVPRHKMFELLDGLRRANQTACTPAGSLPIITNGSTAADGASSGMANGTAFAFIPDILHHLRDDVAGALDYNGILIRISFRAISSSLCNVALDTTTPPTATGANFATGVSVPVRPIWISISLSTVCALSAGNLWAIAQRGFG